MLEQPYETPSLAHVNMLLNRVLSLAHMHHMHPLILNKQCNTELFFAAIKTVKL